ncbi:MAG: hypothetical protein AMXMBFR19_21300 [Chthonomonadaceae bacterium]|nr:DUF4870 domain-containing protein [Fimbriimonadaceae bacterium]
MDSGSGVSQDDRTHAMLCWLLGIIIGIISPVIFMLVDKDKPFVYKNSMQCLTFHIVLLALWVICGILAVVTCGVGIVLYLIPFVWGLIVSILGGIAANNGKVYEPAITASFARSWFKV